MCVIELGMHRVTKWPELSCASRIPNSLADSRIKAPNSLHDRDAVWPRWRARGDRGASSAQAATARLAPSSPAGARVLAGPHHNRRYLLRGAFLAALGAVLAGLPNAASAQSERQGFYAGLQLGVANATPVNSSLSGINHPTRCDVLLYPSSVRPPVHDPACLNTVPAVIASNEFDHGRGLASGFMVGYAAGRVRLEVDYLHRYLGDNTSPLGDTVSAALQGKGSEWSSDQPPHEWIGDYAAHPYGATNRPRLANRRNQVGASGCFPSSLRECPTLCASSYSRPLAG